MKITYECGLCKSVFLAVDRPEGAPVRCPLCGGQKAHRIVDGLSAQSDGKGSTTLELLVPKGLYACPNCVETFELIIPEGTKPTCPRCKREGLLAVGPRATVCNQGTQPISKREHKRRRFVIRAWKNRTDLKNGAKGLQQLARRAGVPEDLCKEFKALCAKALECLDRRHAELLEAYSSDRIRGNG